MFLPNPIPITTTIKPLASTLDIHACRNERNMTTLLSFYRSLCTFQPYGHHWHSEHSSINNWTCIAYFSFTRWRYKVPLGKRNSSQKSHENSL